MGLASSSDPELAMLGLIVFHLPLILTFWFNDRAYSGWAISGFGLYGWLLISVGFNINNPLAAPAEMANIDEATRIYAGWFPVFIAVGLFVGWLISYLMDLREPIPFYAILPSFYAYTIDASKGPVCPNELAALKAYDCDCNAGGIKRWCYERIDPPYWHVLVGLLLVLFNVIVPAILFMVLIANNKWWAFFVPLIMKIVGYILTWAYWWYRTDLYTFGPTEYNTKWRQDSLAKDRDNSPFRYDPEPNQLLYRRTESVVLKNVLIIGLIDVLLFFVIAAIIVFPTTVPSVNLVIGVGLAIVIVLGLIFAIVAIIYYSRGLPVCPESTSPCNPTPSPCSVQPAVCPYRVGANKKIGQKYTDISLL